LTFALAAVAVQLLPDDLKLWFAAWPAFVDIRSYVGLVSHILGHGNWDHLLANFTIILLLGPILEERHGSPQLFSMILITALVTGLINVALGDSMLLGASGIVFMMILLASTANIRAGEIPLTFIAVATIYLGREVVHAFRDDHISQLAHLVGGLTGGAFGFLTVRPARTGAALAPLRTSAGAGGAPVAKPPVGPTKPAG